MPFATAQDFQDVTHVELRPFFQITCEDAPLELVAPFGRATSLIAPALTQIAYLFIVIGNPPMTVPLEHGSLVFAPHAEVVALHHHGVIYLNAGALLPLSDEKKTAVCLEEFVHALMHVRDETLTTGIVNYLLAKSKGQISPATSSP